MRTGKQQAGRSIQIAYGMDGDPAGVATVQRIFSEFTDVYHRFTLTEIARALNVDELATKHGKRWHASTVRYILANTAYADLVGREAFDAAAARLGQLRPGPPR